MNSEVKINNNGDPKLKALEDAIFNIEKKFGKGSILRLGGANSSIKVEVIPSGSLGLDLALGVGGIPGAGSPKSLVRSPRARPPWLSTW